MNKNNPLLFDPPHILPPDVILTPKCENCGDALGSPYYIMVGITPSPLMIDAFSCESIDDEIDLGKEVVSAIQASAKEYEIKSNNQWIFSEQNIVSSKIRVCTECFGESTRPHRWNPLASSLRIHKVCFAVEEHQRRHTPIEPNMSDYQKYIISLPDRASADWRHFGESKVQNEDNGDWLYFQDSMEEYLTIALIPDYKISDALLQEFRTNFIQDKNKLIPNDQELTRWMKKKINSSYDKRIQFCKIFVNQKTQKYPLHRNDEKIYNTRYTVVIHYSIPNGYWEEYDI